MQNVSANDEFEPSRLSDAGQAAYLSLMEASQFEEAFVGFAGSLSNYAIDLETLLNEEEASAAFYSLLESGTTAGKLYALCGLYYVDQISFKKGIAAFRDSKEMVGMMSGCEIYTEEVSKIVESDALNVAIIGADETLEQFLAGHGNREYSIDIAHGGFQATFRHYVKKEKEGEISL